MYEKLLFIRKSLRLIYQFLFLIMLGDLLLGSLDYPLLGVLPIAGIFVILVLSYILRDKVSHGIYLLLSHVAMIIIPIYLVSDMAMKVVIIFDIFYCFYDGLNYMLKGYTLKRIFDTPWEALMFGILTIAVASHFHNAVLTQWGYVLPIVMVIVYLASIYVEGLINYVVSSKNVTGVPVKQIFTTNSFIVSAIMLMIIVVVIISDLLDFSSLAAQLGKVFIGVLKIIAVIFVLIVKLLSAVTGEREVNTRESFQQIEEIAEETNMLATIVEAIVYGLLIALTLYVIYLVFRRLIKVFLSKQDRSYDMTEKLKGGEIDRIKREKIKKNRQGRLTPEQKARSIYKKKVLSYKDKFKPGATDTTKDILRAALKTENKELVDWPIQVEGEIEVTDSMTEMYDRVRYGGEVPDKEFLKHMKELEL